MEGWASPPAHLAICTLPLPPLPPTPAPPCCAARGLLREREGRLGGINAKALALPPGRGGLTQAAQAGAWREYLAWERGNPQGLDPATYVARWALGCAAEAQHAQRGRRGLQAGPWALALARAVLTAAPHVHRRRVTPAAYEQAAACVSHA